MEISFILSSVDHDLGRRKLSMGESSNEEHWPKVSESNIV